jgi:Rieske Fe-S protein
MTDEAPQTAAHPTHTARRTVLAGVGIAGIATALTACGSGGSSTSAASVPSGQASSDPAGSASAPATSAPANGAGGGGGTALGKTADVPVGGGMVFKDQKVVVTQPTAGDFKAFAAVCTHMGCTVGSVSGGTINCPCHGSQFHIADGSVAHGPASSALPPATIAVANGEITLSS